jgi:N-acetylmuramoyl-L-alanine amidase
MKPSRLMRRRVIQPGVIRYGVIKHRAIQLVVVALVVIAGIIVVVGVKTQRPAASVVSGKIRVSKIRNSHVTGPVSQALDPAMFSPGACVAFAPTSGDVHKTVFLDAGHGGIDPGATGVTESGANIDESQVNLSIELDVMALLRADGYRVVVSRTEQTSVVRLTPADVSGNELTVQGAHDDVVARDECANLARANILIGIYMNGGYPGEAGCLTAYDPDRPFAADNLRLATLVQQDVLTAMNRRGLDIPDAGVTSDTELGSAVSYQALMYPHLLLLGPAERGYFSTPSQMPGALIEPLFLTDPFEASVAASPSGQQLIAGGIAQAVGQYFAATPASG